jgi:hypothetical protein
MDPQPFFDFAHERHEIYLRRRIGTSRPWTADPILGHYRFTNVYRELDATTIHQRETIRTRFTDPAALLLAVVAYRWFNRIRTAEAMFDISLGEERLLVNPFDHFVETGETDQIRAAILRHCGDGPYVTGAYIVRTAEGYSKLDGVLLALGLFWRSLSYSSTTDERIGWRTMGESMVLPDPQTMESVWRWLTGFAYIGDFGAYEIVCDLRYTPLLERAPDRMTWANPGPGAMRGLNRLHGRDLKRLAPRAQYIEEMQDLLVYALSDRWPKHDLWPEWEMREVEHTLCEFDKYERVRLGEGRPRGVYR